MKLQKSVLLFAHSNFNKLLKSCNVRKCLRQKLWSRCLKNAWATKKLEASKYKSLTTFKRYVKFSFKVCYAFVAGLILLPADFYNLINPLESTNASYQ